MLRSIFSAFDLGSSLFYKLLKVLEEPIKCLGRYDLLFNNV